MIRRVLLGLLIAAAAVAAFFVFHHPPMRLMPVPLVFRDPPGQLAVQPSALDDRLEVFYATTRLPLGGRDDRLYTVAPDRRIHVGTATLRIGEGASLDQMLDWSTGETDDRPFIHLERLREAASWEPDEAPEAEMQGWLAEVDAALAGRMHRDILVYVHGANTTVERGLGQAAQLAHFSARQAVVVGFVWPTAENFLRYSRDIRTAYGSAPQLARFLSALQRGTHAERIGVFTYSAGSTLGSDALAILAETDPEAAAHVGEVYHAAPDADFAGFVDDLALYGPKAGRTTVAVNLADSALRLAAAVNRGTRAGRPDLAELTPEATDALLQASDTQGLEVVRVQPETMPDLPRTSHTFWYDDPWVSSDVLAAILFHLPPATRGLTAERSAGGVRYWTFPADFPSRIPALQAGLAARLPATAGNEAAGTAPEAPASEPVPPAP